MSSDQAACESAAAAPTSCRRGLKKISGILHPEHGMFKVNNGHPADPIHCHHGGLDRFALQAEHGKFDSSIDDGPLPGSGSPKWPNLLGSHSVGRWPRL